MKLHLPWSLLLASLCSFSNVNQCRSFVARPQTCGSLVCGRLASNSPSRLDAMLLVVEENDDDDDNGADKKKKMDEVMGLTGSSFDGDGGKQESMRIIIDGGDGINSLDDLVGALGSMLGGGAAAPFVGSFSPTECSALPIAKWKQKFEQQPAPFTAVARARLEKEIELLRNLAHGDEAARKLSTLWKNQRGPGPAKVLQTAQSLMVKGHPIAWSQAEQLLLKVMEEEGVEWIEPINLLATLRHLQGRVEESKELYQLILSQKPWHMGAILGAHDACKKLNDYPALVKLDRDVMPPLQAEPHGKTQSREQWVERMVQKAEATLQKAEEGLQSYFHNYNDSGSSQHVCDGNIIMDGEEGEAWQ